MAGVAKLNCYWNQSGTVISDEPLAVLNYWREVLSNMDLIGAYENGVEFGSLSMRDGQTGRFFIPGSATGEIPELEPGHYIRIDACNFEDNAVQCTGPVKASSETLSHAAVYQADPGTNAVIHIHNIELWEEMKGKIPSTGPGCENGTPCMAREIFRLFGETDVIEKRIILMEGDRAGLLIFGNDMDEAVNLLMSYLGKK